MRGFQRVCDMPNATDIHSAANGLGCGQTMCVDICVDMCMDMCMDMCVDMCVDMCIQLCTDMSIEMYT